MRSMWRLMWRHTPLSLVTTAQYIQSHRRIEINDFQKGTVVDLCATLCNNDVLSIPSWCVVISSFVESTICWTYDADTHTDQEFFLKLFWVLWCRGCHQWHMTKSKTLPYKQLSDRNLWLCLVDTGFGQKCVHKKKNALLFKKVINTCQVPSSLCWAAMS